MTKPQRIQLKRTRGWRMPPNTVKVDRSTKWGNPFIPGQAAKVFLPGLMVKDRRHAFVLFQSAAPLNEIECGCDLDDFQPCGEDFSQCIPAYRDPATSFLHASKEHFLPELNNENNKTV